MTASKKTFAAPILIIALGIGWLLTTRNIVPGVNWIWTIGLGVTGVLVVTRGLDKVTVVFGPFLMAATFFSIMRQTGRMSVDTEVPSLVILFGTLMLVAEILPVPIPKWITEPPESKP